MDTKLETISNLFEDNEIRSIWNSEKEEYYFSIVDIIAALTNAKIPRNYWSDLKRKLKQEGIHVALDTCGVGIGDYDKILAYVDLVLFDVKYTDSEGYRHLTKCSMDESLKFIETLNRSDKPVWIRQVIVPGLMDTDDYIRSLAEYLKRFKHIEKIEFLPFHHLGFSKYEKLGIENPLKDTPEMDPEKCEALYQKFLTYYEG